MSLFNVGAYKASKNAVTGKNKVLAYPDSTVGAAGRLEAWAILFRPGAAAVVAIPCDK